MNTMFSWFSFELYKWLWTARGLLGGIWVVNSVYNWGGADAGSAADPVLKSKDHPAILMWTIGTLAVGLIVVDVPDAFAYPDAQRILLGPPPPPNPWAVGGWLVVLLLLLTSIPDWYLTTTTSLWPHYYPPLLGSTRTCSTTPPPTQPQVDDTFVSWADRNICILIYIYIFYIHKCRHVESNVFRTYHLLHGFAEVDSVHLIIFDRPYAT